ncbi:MAG: hypothetical protein J1E57_08575 [Prevotella sp.]|nr:hypothetical protein [Prevotella sp.]
MNRTTIITAFFALIAATTQGQLFRPLGLDSELCERNGNYSQPKMHVEGNILYVCTNQGLYSKDLSNGESAWQLAGFEGIPLLDYVRNGDDILALRYNVDGGFLLLSHDGGKTYEDITPSQFTHKEWTTWVISLAQHPADPNTLLVTSPPFGIFQSSDFGQTWSLLIDEVLGNMTISSIGYHPLNPQVIYNSGEDDMLSSRLNVSYDGGQTWENRSPSFSGDNCVHRIVFHPTNPERWIVGGEGAVFTTTDSGHTWDTQDFWGDAPRSLYWYFTTYDNDNSDIVYMAGTNNIAIMSIMCSTDGGKSWCIPQTEPINSSVKKTVNDLQQYSDKLLIYAETDVYEISKAELLAASTASVPTINTKNDDSPLIYDLQGRRKKTYTKRIGIRKGKKYVIK